MGSGEEGGGLGPGAAAGRFLFDCLGSERDGILNARTGKSSWLPAGTSWYLIGTRYVQGNKSPGGANPHQVVYDLTTGAVKRVREPELIDLDAPGAPGETAICSKLRRSVHKEGGIEFAGDFAYEKGLFVHEYGGHGAVRIDRCNGGSTILRGQHVNGEREDHKPHYLDLRGGLLSWDTGDTPTEFGKPGFHSELHSYDLSTGESHRWTLPRVFVKDAPEYGPGSYGYSTHTENTVFWIETRTIYSDKLIGVETSSVYAGRL